MSRACEFLWILWSTRWDWWEFFFAQNLRFLQNSQMFLQNVYEQMLCFIPSQWYVFSFCNDVLTTFVGTPIGKYSNFEQIDQIWKYVGTFGTGAILSPDDTSDHGEDHSPRLWDKTGMVGTTWVYHQCSSRPGNESSIFSPKTFRRRVFQEIVSVYHIMHINKHHSTHIVSIRIPSIRIVSIRIHSIRIQFTRIHSIHIHSIRISMHQQEWQWMWMQNISLHRMHQLEWHRFAFAPPSQSILSPGIFQCHFYYFPRSEAFWAIEHVSLCR